VQPWIAPTNRPKWEMCLSFASRLKKTGTSFFASEYYDWVNILQLHLDLPCLWHVDFVNCMLMCAENEIGTFWFEITHLWKGKTTIFMQNWSLCCRLRRNFFGAPPPLALAGAHAATDPPYHGVGVYCCLLLVSGFYCAMQFSAKRGLAIACRPSVCSSVCLWHWWFVIT